MMDFTWPCHQEFISFCEAIELVPEEELESSAQATGNTFADQRATKVDVDFFLFFYFLMFHILFMTYYFLSLRILGHPITRYLF